MLPFRLEWICKQISKSGSFSAPLKAKLVEIYKNPVVTYELLIIVPSVEDKDRRIAPQYTARRVIEKKRDRIEKFSRLLIWRRKWVILSILESNIDERKSAKDVI